MVVIIGGTHHNTLSMVRALGEKDIMTNVILVGHNQQGSYLLASKYVQRYYVCESDEEALSILMEKYNNATVERTVVIASSDGIASIMDKHYDELKENFLFFNCCRQGALTYYMDKQVQVSLARECGLIIPQSIKWVVSDNIPLQKQFPCIVKPLESIHGGKNFKVCNNATELFSVLNKYQKEEVVQIQEYIKRDYEIVVDGLSLGEEIIIPGFVIKLRDSLGGTTYSETRDVSEIPADVVESIKCIVHKIEYIGLFGVELIVSRGQYYFIEINLRNDATTYSVSKAGVNLPFIYYSAMKGSKCSQDLGSHIVSIKSMVEFRDFDNVLKGKISLFKWTKQRKSCGCTYFYDEKDMNPYFAARKKYYTDKFRTLINKLRLLK